MTTTRGNTFAGQLKHFAQVVDIVDSSIFDQVRDLIYKYVKNELKGEYFELLSGESSTVHGERQWSLRTFWSSDEKLHNWPVRAEDGTYLNPVTAAFENNRPMWLVSPDREPLGPEGKYTDMWSDSADVSPYWPASGEEIRTVIIVPLIFRQTLGAYCIESSEYIEITNVAKSELRVLADGLAILYSDWDFRRAQSASTSNAVSDLRDALSQAKFPKLAKPHMFLAFSNRADETVKLAITDVLDEFSDQLEWTNWSQMSESGNISAQIGKEIMESKFGICYLSEPTEANDAAPAQYIDNPNVVFEAGMLHARTTAAVNQDASEPAGWIPIRESASPPPPFDFASERILYVPRSAHGDLNETKLTQMLTDRIRALLRES